MFENIIGQNNVISILKEDFQKRTLNNSMLFYGPKFNGKLTSAFELARILNCQENQKLDCRCSNCTSINNLSFEGLVFISRRDFSYILKEYIECYKTNKEDRFLEEIINIIKLISLPLQDHLIKDTFSETDKKKIGNIIEKLNEFIMLGKKVSSKDFENIVSLSGELSLLYKSMNIPVDTLRAMIDWTYIKRENINKVVIIDHVDMFEKSSQNVLLKRVEEPSSNLFFILLAENKNNVSRTIISRCRNYYFTKLNQKNVTEVVNKFFLKDTQLNSLENYFLRNESYSKENVFPNVIKFINLVFQKESPFSELSLFLNSLSDKKYIQAFMNELLIQFDQEILRREENMKISEIHSLEKCSNYNLKSLKDLIKKKIKQINSYSINPVLALEGIFYPVKAMVENDRIKLS